MRRALAAVAVSALVLTGCGGPETDAAETPSESPSASTESAPEPPPSASPSEDKTDDGGIEIEIEGDEVEPNGKRVKVEAGERIRLEVDSDRAGEFHVHSSPEQEIPFKRGKSVVTLKVATPGIVDVEEHATETVLLQLEVR